MCFRRILTILLVLSADFLIFSQEKLQEHTREIPVGNALSTAVEASLHKNGFSPIAQELSATGQDAFAYNISVEFAPSETGKILSEQEDTDSSLSDSHTDSLKTEMIFCFTQEDFFSHEEALVEFLRYLKSLEKPFSITVLFSTLDFSDGLFHPLNGTEVFTTALEGSENAFAIPVTFDSTTETAIRTGGLRATSPLWLTERMSGSFFDTRTDFVFETSLSSLYTLGLLKGSERLAHFAPAGIPAIEISFAHESDIAVLTHFVDTYTIEGTEFWDQHYFYISFGGFFKPFFINERAILLSCFIFGLISIMLVCIFSFTGKNGEKNKRDFQRAFYLIPITLGISLLSLYLGQYAVTLLSRILPVNLLIQYGIKILFSMLVVSLMFNIQERLKLSVAIFVYGYLLSLVSIFNIFLFSSQNLLLFIAFVAEYIIIYLSRITKRLSVLIVFFVLMTLPFMPYAFKIIKYADEAGIARHVYSTLGGNLLLTLALFPFQIMWLRILFLLNVYSGAKGYTPRRMILNSLLYLFIVITFIFSALFLISTFIYKPDTRTRQRAEQVIVPDEQGTLSAWLSTDAFSGMNTHHVHIRSYDEAVRYTVTIHGIDTPHPIYDSVYDYEVISNGDADIINFIIPDYPPKNITIDYAADMFSSARIEITAFYRTDEPHTFRTEKRELKVE